MWRRIYPLVVLLIFANTIFKVSCKGNGSLTFLIDDTQSMSDDIEQVLKSVDKITNILKNEKSSLIDNMVLVTFNDPGVHDRVVTRDPEEFKKELGSITPHNEAKISEWDCWEPSMKGLLQALNKSKNYSYIFVFTDASAKDYIDSRYVIEMCQKKQTQIVFVLTGRLCRRSGYVPEANGVYFDIAVACSGLAIFVKKNEVEKVFGPIEEIIKGNKTVITTAIVPANVSRNISFAIDDYTDYVIVSASGKDIKLKINGPSVSLEEIMSTDNAIVVKLSNTKPGNYVATVKGKTNTSVVIVGRTDFFFTHGFSELKPKSLSDTSPQPKSDAKGYLSVSVTDDNHSVRIESAKILDMDGKPIIKKLPLTEISQNFYTTDPFVAPSQRFKIAVEGIVKATNKPIIRTAKIPVTPPPPKITPKVQGVDVMKVNKGKTAVIECEVVRGFPSPKISWQFWGESDSKFTHLTSSESVLRITNVKHKHEGMYKCVADNGAGRDEHVTTLFVQELPKIVSSDSNIYNSTEGDALLRIPCVAAGLPKPSITWKLNDLVIYPSAKYSIENGTLIIKDPKVSDTNSYTCEAKNKVGAVSMTFRASISQAPQVSGVTDKKVRIGTSATIECKVVKGEPKPTITWKFMANSGFKFVLIPGSYKVLNISKEVENKHAGRYKCIAKNKIGSDEHVTTLIVESLPVITTKSTTVQGIEGDLALRIPCEVVGIPQPVVTWKINGTKITTDGKYSIEDGALVIVKPTRNDSSWYTCEAENNVGSVRTMFQAAVEKHLRTFGTKHYVYILQGETRKLKCEAYNSESQSVRWFEATAKQRQKDSSLSTTTPLPKLKSSETTTPSSQDYSSSTMLPTIMLNEAINEPYIQIVNASDLDDGSYTCRVSEKHGNTHTHTYVVDVGSAPKFLPDASLTLSNWHGVISEITQNCDVQADVKPKPVVEWTFNGKVFTDFNLAGVGHYTCTVRNVHGSVQKKFNVTSSVCLITRNLKDVQYMPLVLNDKGFWHKLKTTKHYTVVKQKDEITLSCPSQKDTSNTFNNFPEKNTLQALCYKEDSFVVEDTIYKLSDLQCTNSVQPSVIRKKVKCLTETSELLRVGYNISGFLEAYEVCFDTEKNMPLYTRIIMTEADNNAPSAGYNWYTYPGIGYEKTEKGFSCTDTISSCCYSKSQLVNAKDFNDGPAKKTTFIDPLNVIPVWLPCNTSKPSWENINDMVRSALPTYIDIVTWSGTHTLQEKNGVIIPRYLWKVLRLVDDEAVAIVHVNDPNPIENDIKCKNICDKYNEWFISNDKYTYCCSLPDFYKSFDIQDTDIGESMGAVLDKIKKST